MLLSTIVFFFLLQLCPNLLTEIRLCRRCYHLEERGVLPGMQVRFHPPS